MPDVFQFGPSGGTGGNSGDTDSDEGSLQPRTRVADVLLSFDDTNHHALESIQFIHENLPPGGGVVFLPRHGGSGHEPITVSLDTNEHITKISGTYNLDGNKGPFVTSISMETNTGVHNTTLPNGGVTDGAKYS